MTTKNRDLFIINRYYSERKGGLNDLGGFTSRTQKLVRNRTGVSVPHWKDKIRQHQDASSALSGRFDSFADTAGNMTVNYRVDAITGQNSATGTKRVREFIEGNFDAYANSMPIPQFSWSSVADGRARNKFLSNVRKVQTKVQGAVFLKEIDQTWHMLHRPASALWDSINRYYGALKRLKRTGGIEWIKALPSLWLEYSFGWRPLMMDIDGAFDALNSLTNVDGVIRVVGSGSDSHLVSQTSGSNSPGSAFGATKCWFTTFKTVTERDTVRYIGGVNFKQMTTFAEKSAQWGFTPAEFLPSAWEILPWSFLVDYFVTIGDYLDASFANNSSIIWCVKTQRQICESYRTSVPDHATAKAQASVGYVSSFGQASWSKYRRRTVNRVVVNGNEITPALYVKWNGPTSGQFANISALFGQASSNLHTQQYSGRTYRIR